MCTIKWAKRPPKKNWYIDEENGMAVSNRLGEWRESRVLYLHETCPIIQINSNNDFVVFVRVLLCFFRFVLLVLVVLNFFLSFGYCSLYTACGKYLRAINFHDFWPCTSCCFIFIIIIQPHSASKSSQLSCYRRKFYESLSTWLSE